MSDPLAVAGSAVGIISLGLQIAQSLYNYYDGLKNQYADVTHTTRKLNSMLQILDSLRAQLGSRTFRPGEEDHVKTIEAAIQDCEECLQDLEQEVKKFQKASSDTFTSLGVKATARAVGRRIAYPLRQSTLQKLDEDIDDVVACISFALQLLQQKSVDQTHDDVDDINKMLELVRASQVNSEIRDWLRAPDASINFNEACSKRHPGTGLWFVKGGVFTAWLYEKSFLWVKGFAGCGKSVLSSTAVKYALRHRRSDPCVGIAFFYFSFNDKEKQSLSAMLRALILQLSSQLKETPSALERLYNSYRSALPPDEALLDCLSQIAGEFRDVYIILDALDECPRGEGRQAVLEAISTFRKWSRSQLHLLATSRDEVDIRADLDATAEQTINMSNDGINQDIASFVSQRLRQDRRLRQWGAHFGRIESILINKANGVFRWVECQFAALASCPASEYLLEQLLSDLPDTLDKTYERMLNNIPPILKDHARQLLTILCCSVRPMTLSEVIGALAVEVGEDPCFNPKRLLQNAEDVERICPGFIQITETVDLDGYRGVRGVYVRIAHFSVQEYLQSDRIRKSKQAAWFSVQEKEAHNLLACTCLALLLDSRAERLSQQNPSGLEWYAADKWSDSYRRGTKTAQTEAQVKSLFSEFEGAFSRWARILGWRIPGTSDAAKLSYRIYQAAWLGCYTAIIALLKAATCAASEVPNMLNIVHNGWWGTALQAASVEGYQDIVELLLANGASVNVYAGSSLCSALTAASGQGRVEIVQILLKNGALVNVDNEESPTALSAAAGRGFTKTVRVLLDHGANVNACNKSSATALYAASHGGFIPTMLLLLQRGADVNTQMGHMDTALQAAVSSGSTEAVQLLLEWGADIDVKDGHFSMALQAAVFSKVSATVKLLLERGASVHRECVQLRAGLLAAAHVGSVPMLKMLLDRGADVHENDMHGTMLQRAVHVGKKDVVQLLLESGVDVNVRSPQGYTALQIALVHKREELAQLLLDNGAAAHESAWLAASSSGLTDVVQRFLDQGVDINLQGIDPSFQDENRRLTALHLAAEKGHAPVVQLLLSQGADVNICSWFGTALHHAATGTSPFKAREAAMQLLLDHGVDIHARGSLGTAWQAAVLHGQEQAEQWLHSHGAEEDLMWVHL